MIDKSVITDGMVVSKALKNENVKIAIDEPLTTTATVTSPTIKVEKTEDPTVKVLMLKGESGGGDGTNVYDKLSGKPSINGVLLVGNLEFETLGEETITNEELKNIIDKQFMEVFG